MKARGQCPRDSIVLEYLETLMKQEVQVFEMASHQRPTANKGYCGREHLIFALFCLISAYLYR